MTLRSILLGAVLCIAINVGEPYLVGYVHTSPLSADFSTGAAIFLIFVLSVLNLLLQRLHQRWAFSTSELLVCYIMMLVACAIPSWGFTFLLIPWIVAPTYYATPENRWEDLIVARLPEEYFVLDKEAATQFFDGLKGVERLPWHLWIEPLARWGLFILCFYVAGICLMIILRRQWVHHERLSYPLAQLPLAIVSKGHGDERHAFGRAAFWLGVAVPAFVYSLKGLHAYFPNIPMIRQGTGVWIREFNGSILFRIYFEVIGLAFLLTADMAFSLWLFALLSFLEQGLFNSVGFTIGPMQPYSQPGRQEVSNQALGAMVVLVLIGLWRAREHLGRTLSVAMGRARDPEEEGEVVSYRVAWLGLLLAGGYVLWFWSHTGLGLSTLVLGFWMVILFVGLSRAVAQGGMAYARSPVVSAVATLHSVGTARLGPEGIIGLAMTAPYAMDTRTTVMASMANALRLSEEIPRDRRRLGIAVLVTLVVSLLAAFVTVLYLPYRHGCLSLGGWGFSKWYHLYIYNWAKDQMLRGTPVGWFQFGFMGFGSALMLGLMWLQKHVFWWPIHPLGLALGYTHPVAYTWFSVFLAWLAKVLIIWTGGGALYRKARPFFIGMAVGGFVTAGFWAIVHTIVGHGAVGFTLG